MAAQAARPAFMDSVLFGALDYHDVWHHRPSCWSECVCGLAGWFDLGTAHPAQIETV